MPPLQIYLDSSDFSNLAAGRVAPEIVGQLESLRAAGKIELRFSFVHVAEAAPVDVQYLRSGISRLHSIHHLCWPHAVMAQADVLQMKAEQLGSGRLIPFNVLKDDGDWFPRDVSDDPDLALRSREDLLRDILTERKVSRQQRRLYLRHGFLTPKGARAIIESEDALIDAIKREFPLDRSAKAAIRGYVRGEISGAAAMQSVIKSIRDLTVFASWLETQWASTSRTTIWLHQTGLKQQQSWMARAEDLKQSAERSRDAGLDKEQFLKIGNRALNEAQARAVTQLAAAALDDRKVSITPEALSNAAYLAPGTTLLAALLFQVARATYLQPAEGGRAPKKSDFGDLAHCIYLPYVDLFRADAFMTDTIEKATSALSKRVARNLPELMTMVLEKLAGKQS